MIPHASRPQEAALVLAAMIASGALIAQQVSGKATRDALFLSNLDVEKLPPVMIASSVVSLGAVFFFSGALSRRSPSRVVPAAFGMSALLLLSEWGLSREAPRLAALAVYLHMAVFGAPLISGFWSVINERFDPYTAKRVVGRIGAGATLGGVLGGVVTLAAADLVKTSSMLVLMAGLNVLSLWGVLRLRPRARGRPAGAAESEAKGTRSAASGLRVLREVPYLRSLAAIIALGAMAEGLLDYVLKSEAASAFTGGAQLVSFFALFHTTVGLLAFAVQTLVSRVALERLGLAGTIAVRPAAVAALGLAAAAYPRLSTAVLVRGAEAVLNHSLFRNGYELLYTPLSQDRKRPAKAIVDVGFDRLGVAAGSLVAILVLSLPTASPNRLLIALGAVSGLLALVLFPRVHRGYVGTLADNLRSGALKLDPAEVMDSTTRLTLTGTAMGLDREQLLRQIQALGQSRAGTSKEVAAADTLGRPSGPGVPIKKEEIALSDPLLRAVADLRGDDRGRIRKVLAEGEALDARLVAHAIPLLAKDDLFPDALQALRKLAPRSTGALLDALLDPEAPLVVRRRIPRVLKACATQRAADGLLQGLLDERFEIRYPCGLALARITARNSDLVIPRREVFAAALKELDTDRRPVDMALADASPESLARAVSPGPAREAEDRRLEHVFTLLSLVLEREPLQIALRALTSEDEALRGTALEYLENILPEAIRESLWFYLGVRVRAAPRARSSQQALEDLKRSLPGSPGRGSAKGTPRR